MKEVIAIIESGDDGTYSIHAPQLENVIIGEGDSVDEAKSDFENSYQEMLESYIIDGVPIPNELREIGFEYRNELG